MLYLAMKCTTCGDGLKLCLDIILRVSGGIWAPTRISAENDA